MVIKILTSYEDIEQCIWMELLLVAFGQAILKAHKSLLMLPKIGRSDEHGYPRTRSYLD